MTRYLRLLTLTLLAGCNGQEAPTPPSAESQLSSSTMPFAVEGPGGIVRIGDSLADAKRAFPPPPRAHVFAKGMSFAITQRPGWSWGTETPDGGGEAFEVSLKDGKVAGIAITQSSGDKAQLHKRVTETLRKLPPALNESRGRTASAWSWKSGRDARIIIALETGLMSSGPMLMILIGDQDDIKLLNYRADDVATTVRQIDLGAEAMRSAPGRAPKRKPGT